jgi:drug/metabolite transporter (DMT)-like permease
MFYFSMLLTVLSNLLYHLSQKAIPRSVNPMVSILATYATAIVLSSIVLLFYPSPMGIAESLKKLNWSSVGVGVAIVGVEIGFLLAYRAGWNISLGAVASNVAVTILLVPVGIAAFHESLSARNSVGIALCVVGLLLIA